MRDSADLLAPSSTIRLTASAPFGISGWTFPVSCDAHRTQTRWGIILAVRSQSLCEHTDSVHINSVRVERAVRHHTLPKVNRFLTSGPIGISRHPSHSLYLGLAQARPSRLFGGLAPGGGHLVAVLAAAAIWTRSASQAV